MIPHHISKGETIARSLKDRFDYGQNPDKTRGGELISSYECDHQTAELKDDPGYKCDAVFLVAYYANNGYIKETPGKNIKRLGILHVTGIDWGVYNNSNFGSTKVTYNCYWQKYDYDYSKL